MKHPLTDWAKQNQKANQNFLTKSNNRHVINELPLLSSQVFEEVDCLDCANCCKNYSPRFNQRDIKRISKFLGLKEGEFVKKYLYLDKDNDYVLQSKPCPFLGVDNYCSIYEVRPLDCQRYPYIEEDVFVKQVSLSIKNTTVCPAAALMVQKMKDLYQNSI